MSGADVHQVAVGPIHAGVIESGHFRLHVVGERVLHLDVRLFYKRRGLEAAAAGVALDAGIVYAGRACAACTVTNTVVYAGACESALGLVPDENLRRARTLLLELERIYGHLGDLSAVSAGVGFAAATMAYAALKERAHRLNEQLTSHRFLFGSVAVGSSPVTVDARMAVSLRAELAALATEHRVAWRELRFNRSFGDRLDGVGVWSVMMRSGWEPSDRWPAQAQWPRTSALTAELSYPGFVPAVAPDAVGDVESRVRQRALELEQSFALLDELLSAPIGAGVANYGPSERGDRGRPANALGIARVESPRGRTVCLVEPDGNRVGALHLRTGSYANWPVLADTVSGNLLPDFPLINKSFELCYACSDL